MIKKVFLYGCMLLVLAAAGLWLLGLGLWAEPWKSAEVVSGPRVEVAAAHSGPSILFGDLHVHTSFSLDAALFGLPLVTDSDIALPSDACDFARYCSALDFWSINDHAEGMTPRSWRDSVQAIRDCNAQSGDPANPDLVSLLGWEWSHTSTEAATHYGHKNVIFREWEQGRSPLRPIASSRDYFAVQMMPAPLRGYLSIHPEFQRYQDFAHYIREAGSVPACPEDIHTAELPADCREVAETPELLYRKLEELGYDSLVIPHGLAWGRTNRRDADFSNQLAQHNPKYQRLIETYSGHGNSELFADFERRITNGDGGYSCPAPGKDFIPCCHRAGELIRERCEEPDSVACEQRVETARSYATEVLDDRSRAVVSGATPEDWGNCGQLLNSFLPAWYYIPRQSTQYNLALGGFSATGSPQRARFGIMAASDGHKGRPGSGYKEFDRIYMTDTKDVGESGGILGSLVPGGAAGERGPDPVKATEQGFLGTLVQPDRIGSFYYTGGLTAVHAQGRDRDSLWRGMENKQVYGASGERILLWFDLLNSPDGVAPMGSEVRQIENPRFRVRALGAFKQQPGCPDYSRQALGEQRVADLCRGECYHPGDERKAITRIEVVRIRPQRSPEEPVAGLIDDNWRVFDCPVAGQGCEIEFEDAEFSRAGRETLYYVRAIQEPQATINGDNFRCEYNAAGECVKFNFCIDEQAPPGEDCLAAAEPRA